MHSCWPDPKGNKWKVKLLAYFLTCSGILKGPIWAARKACLLSYLLWDLQRSKVSCLLSCSLLSVLYFGYMIVREQLSKYFKYFQVFSKYSGIVRILVQVRK